MSALKKENRDTALVDLHMHTLYSDGVLAPGELVRKAQQRGLCALSVTDHDALEGWEEARAAGQAQGVEVIPGVELSVTVGAQEVHLLGYLFDPQHPALRDHLDAFREARYNRARKMVERLSTLGAPVAFEAVLRAAGAGRVLGRPHVAAALVAAGHVSSAQEAFERYLHDGGPACVGKPRFPASRALRLLHEAGGLGVLAHPGHWTSSTLIRRLVRAGLDGIEVVHPSHDATLTRYYRKVAREAALLTTGGSDYHGQRVQDEDNLGVYGVPYAQLRRLRRRAA